MRVLIVGGGAREHALAWKIRQSPKVTELFVAPGNAGTAAIANNLDIKSTDINGLLKAVQQYKVDFTVVGPEAPLEAGIVDLFSRYRLRVFGPTKAAAKLETSKVFAKKLMYQYRIPTAAWSAFFNPQEAMEYIKRQDFPLVVKADGLAAGKGVVVVNNEEEAGEAISLIMERKAFGEAGGRVVIEKCLSGREVSLLALTDGVNVLPLAAACDYKRALDGNQGANTGGMGGYSPPGFFDDKLAEQVRKVVLEASVRGMSMSGTLYKGVLYAGLMITQDDGPRVLEFNARFGDPETQVILPRMKSDLMPLLEASVDGKLNEQTVTWTDEVCVGVVLASGGYPGSYQTGFPISGLDKVKDDVLVFHAGTRVGENGEVITDGGRVATVVGRGKTMAEARSKVYSNVTEIGFIGCHYRRDIGAEVMP